MVLQRSRDSALFAIRGPSFGDQLARDSRTCCSRFASFTTAW
jgi:hypothetical protein